MITKKINNNKKTFILKISEEGLRVIIDALECFSRLGIGQFKFALEFLPQFDKLPYEERLDVENYLKEKTNIRGYIYSPEVEYFTKSFQIKKEIEKWVALENSGGIRNNYSVIFDGSLNKDDYLPQFLDKNFKHLEDKKEFLISEENREKLAKLMSNQQFDEAWKFVNDVVDFKGIHGAKSEISSDCKKVTIYEPYKRIRE